MSMRKSIVAAFISFAASCGLAAPLTPAFADTTTKTASTTTKPSPRYRFVGLDFSAGAPDGASIGLVLRPLYFSRFEIAGTYNGIAPGMRGGLTLDFVPWAISPTLTAEGGATFSGAVPFVSNPPSVEYKYANFHLGLEMGNWRVWRFYVRGGFSWIDAQTHNFNNVIGNTDTSLTIGDPRLTGWVPSGKIGFMYLF